MSKPEETFSISVEDAECLISEPGKTLLETLENNNIQCHFHCRDGFCGACRTRLLSGEVNYTTDPLAFIDDNEILPCCCYPVSDINIKVTM